ncbi:hypothetical protein BW730_10040 [Tessaracoccus aquimaris]|uniref:Allophanate hydrolase n=1 Tax=Tessaracoccus aquimaris TaxID=1332264 RepID=A0A1Q2CNT6_9ACTN|nr:urea amidolyase family protein [Tessaracoccus aquimaris]AQP47781.1 hypothetical protein BW730_10040 [Tessaracoccus aquimaris]
MRLLACGERALLVEFASLDEVLAAEPVLRAAAAATRGPWASVTDVIPAARTVLVVGAPAAEGGPAVAALLSGPRVAAASGTPREVVIPVRYDGPDLAAVADETGLTVAEVVRAHVETPWQVAFGGFAPGFSYLVGGDPRLRVPRLASPRTRVPAGSVGLADEFSGIYPTSSPGGWRLLGTTDVTLFDPGASPPALLTPGTTVRFEAVPAGRTSTPARGAERAATPPTATVAHATKALIVESALLPVTAQDEGRTGLGAVGVGASGAADLGSYRLGERLVGNPPGGAALEITLGQVVVRAVGDHTVAMTGAPCRAEVDGRPVSPGVAFALRDGERLTLGPPAVGLRSYLSVRGGVAVEEVLGSRSTDTLGGLGPAPLTAGTEVPVGEARAGWLAAVDWTPVSAETSDVVELRYLQGPRAEWVEGLDGSTWVVGGAVDRVGARLTGEPLRRAPGELPSEPVVRGAIQVPPSGEPVLFLADHPVTGGYPVVGVLTPQAADSAAQLVPGRRCRLVREARPRSGG